MPRGRLFRWGRLFRGATLPALLLLAVAAVAALGFLDSRDLVHRTWTEPSRTTTVTLEPVTPVIILPGRVPAQQSQTPSSDKQRADRLRHTFLFLYAQRVVLPNQ